MLLLKTLHKTIRGIVARLAVRLGRSAEAERMPFKANDKHRHKIPRARYRVKNWRDYDAALRRRGDLTVWVTPAALAAWTPPRTAAAGDRSKRSL